MLWILLSIKKIHNVNKHIKNYYKQKLFKFYEVKLIRANSECLGTRRR